jgi:hypothetical protein
VSIRSTVHEFDGVLECICNFLDTTLYDYEQCHCNIVKTDSSISETINMKLTQTLLVHGISFASLPFFHQVKNRGTLGKTMQVTKCNKICGRQINKSQISKFLLRALHFPSSRSMNYGELPFFRSRAWKSFHFLL